VTTIARVLLDEFEPDDLAALAQRLAPYLPAPAHDGQPGQWLTLRQAADYLRIGYSTAKRHAAEGYGRSSAKAGAATCAAPIWTHGGLAARRYALQSDAEHTRVAPRDWHRRGRDPPGGNPDE
jgi:hypothetical protein